MRNDAYKWIEAVAIFILWVVVGTFVGTTLGGLWGFHEHRKITEALVRENPNYRGHGGGYIFVGGICCGMVFGGFLGGVAGTIAQFLRERREKGPASKE